MKYQCRSCGREIRHYNVENFESRCADCWWAEKDSIIAQKQAKDDEEKKNITKDSHNPCYMCGKLGFVDCRICGKKVCADHAVPGRKFLRTHYCDNCFRKKLGGELLFLFVSFLGVAILFAFLGIFS